MKIRFGTAALLACLALGGPAMAQDMKPGLWELTNNVGSSNGQMQAAISEARKQLANMSPEQRQAVQQMLQKNGVELDVGDGGALRSRMCVTREMIERKEMPMQQGDCSYKMTPLGANRLKVNFACTRPRASGEGEMTVDTPTRYHARMTVRNQDQPDQAVDMDVSGRWLAASCGKVRPIQLPSVNAR
jgi:hypothetical protein